MAEIIKSCVYQEPPSTFSTVVSVLTFLGLAALGILETTGKHLQYSKFWNVGGASIKASRSQTTISSRIGMLIFYTPALLAGISSFFIFPGGGTRFLLLKSAIAIHFLKRDLEVLFLHKFSGFIVLDSAVVISTIYIAAAAGMAYFQNTTQGFPEPAFDLKYIGVFLFVVGIFGNLYHHYLLSKLRDTSDKGYKIPKGGLFSLVICPHYLFEITVFMGMAFISQTLFSYSCAFASASYLVGRSYTTRKWYRLDTKFEDQDIIIQPIGDAMPTTFWDLAGRNGMVRRDAFYLRVKAPFCRRKVLHCGPTPVSAKSPQYLLSSRTGMLLVYTPALLAGITSFVLFPGGDTRFILLKSAITIHFLKRDLEVLFIHKYSAFMVLDFAIIGFFSYLAVAAGMLYYQSATQGFPEPVFDLKHIGVLLFLVGIFGKLRGNGEKAYKIPSGGLFCIIVCPHYLFEILTFIGISFISQTLFAYSFTAGSALCLAGKSYATRKWYLSKFDNFPKNVKALIASFPIFSRLIHPKCL